MRELNLNEICILKVTDKEQSRKSKIMMNLKDEDKSLKSNYLRNNRQW